MYVINSRRFLTKGNGLQSYRNLSDVRFIRGNGPYATFYLNDGLKYTLTLTLKNLETIVESNMFVRVHKSYMVNPKYVNSISDKDMVLNQDFIPISRRKLPFVKEYFKSWKKRN